MNIVKMIVKLWLGFCPTFIAFWFIASMPDSPRQASVDVTTSAITFSAFDAIFSSNKTELQHEQSFADLKGKPVVWEGIVEEVTAHSMNVKEKLSTLTYDVIVDFDPSERSMSSLGKGMKVRYSGTIENYGGAIVGHRLSNGKIISYSAMSDLEAAKFLHDSELDGHD